MPMFESPRQEREQDAEYVFPYHYIARLSEFGFAQHIVDTWGLNYVSTIEFMLEKIAECQPESLIDIGCGDGRFTREIWRKWPAMKVVGVDYSARALNLAKAMNQEGAQIEFKQLDIVNESFVETYDVAILMEVFEHIPVADAEKFLGAVSRLVKTGGTLLLTVPHSNKPLEYKHYQHFTVSTLLGYLEPLFEVEQIIPFEREGLARRLLNRLLCNRVFILNEQRLLNWLYRLHQRHLFYCADERTCQRLFVKAKIKNPILAS